MPQSLLSFGYNLRPRGFYLKGRMSGRTPFGGADYDSMTQQMPKARFVDAYEGE